MSNWEVYVQRLAEKNGKSRQETDLEEAGRIIRKITLGR